MKFIATSVYDLLARRVDLISYFNMLQRKSKNYQTQASGILRKIHFNDFVILFIKSITNKEMVGILLSDIGVGVPLFYAAGEKF